MAQFASHECAAYHRILMPSALRKLYAALFLGLLLALALPLSADDSATFFPLSDVKPGMKGVVYTIYQGDQIEKIDLVVIGTIENALGPKQDVILVQLLGEKAEHSGVVAGMSGSPVYFDGKLAGALSLKLGIFTKEAIGGVTPIANMIDIEKSNPAQPPTKASTTAAGNDGAAIPSPFSARVVVPEQLTRSIGVGSGEFLIPIETPVISAGLYPETIAQFAKQFSGWGVSLAAGGTAPASPGDSQLEPGDMVGMELVRGDLTLTPGCTVTRVDDGRVYACGHPIFSFGSIAMPMVRGHVITTLNSAMASTKIMSSGSTIGTFTQDRLTAIMGQLGSGPPMIPVDVTLQTSTAEKQFHFEVVENPLLTPTLVAVTTFNGIIGSPAYGEGSTLELHGEINVRGHSPVMINDLFAPTDNPVPAGVLVATDVQGIFARIYSNPYEIPRVEGVHIRVTALPDRREATIDGAWLDKVEARPGDTVAVKVQLRPYRGPTFVQEIPISIPAQAAHGQLQLVISDSAFVNRNIQAAAASSQGQLPGLEQLINLVNLERQNDRLYATLLQPTPTLTVEDKIMPNAPTSEINVLDQRQNPTGARVTYQSTAGEWSVPMHQVISGERMLTITVK
jgi:SpoIVB peptidase S55